MLAVSVLFKISSLSCRNASLPAPNPVPVYPPEAKEDTFLPVVLPLTAVFSALDASLSLSIRLFEILFPMD